jgi:hypothetical protein
MRVPEAFNRRIGALTQRPQPPIVRPVKARDAESRIGDGFAPVRVGSNLRLSLIARSPDSARSSEEGEQFVFHERSPGARSWKDSSD